MCPSKKVRRCAIDDDMDEEVPIVESRPLCCMIHICKKHRKWKEDVEADVEVSRITASIEGTGHAM